MSLRDRLHLNDSGEDDSGVWFITFADMVVLLMAFFLLLYSFSKIDASRMEVAMKSLQKAMNVTTDTTTAQLIEVKAEDMQSASINSYEDIAELQLRTIQKKVQEYAYQNNMSNKISAYIDERGVIIKVADDVLFDSGKAGMRTNSQFFQNYLADLIKTYPYPIRVEGHTDNTPINTLEYPSNWELSTSRACNIIRGLIARGLNPALFSAEGFAEFRPIASNTVESGRAKNRRVEIIYKREEVLKALRERSKKTI